MEKIEAFTIPQFIKKANLKGITTIMLRSWIDDNKEELIKNRIVLIIDRTNVGKRKTYRILDADKLRLIFLGK